MERKRKEMKCQTGRWTQAESRRFMNAIEKYGRNWFEVQKKVKTRSIPQIRSHAQKMFLNLPEEDIQALFSLPKSQSETIVNCKPGNGSEKKEFKSLKQKTGINAQGQDVNQVRAVKGKEEYKIEPIENKRMENITNHQNLTSSQQEVFQNQFMFPPNFWFPQNALINLEGCPQYYQNLEFFNRCNNQQIFPQNCFYQNPYYNKNQ